MLVTIAKENLVVSPGTGELAPQRTPEQQIHRELGQRVYSRTEELRLRALARVGISPQDLASGARGVRHTVTLSSPSRRLQVDIGADSQLRTDEDTLRQVNIRHNPYEGEEFHRGRFVEPDGSMWQAADSSQGQPWYKAELPSSDLVGMLERLDELESANYNVDVTLSAYQQVGTVTTPV